MATHGITPSKVCGKRECNICPSARCYGCPRINRHTVTLTELTWMIADVRRHRFVGIPLIPVVEREPENDATIQAFRTAHVYYECLRDCTEGNCKFCKGGLLVCNVCGQAEGELPEYCTGYPCKLVIKS